VQQPGAATLDRRERLPLLGGRSHRLVGAGVGERRAPPRARRDRHQPAALEPPQRSEVAARDARQSSSSARWPAVSRCPSSGAAVRAAHSSIRGRPRGGSTSDSARAGVEQYSAAIQSASSTSSGGTESARTAVGVTSLPSGTAVVSEKPVTTPSSAWRPNGIRTIEPTCSGAAGSA
jgi:hypothetical protein